ncbi:MAG: type II secretion system protein [Phycisphaerae bacterium]|nr:type II secretion system protein [Phycisphaerae bacterium]
MSHELRCRAYTLIELLIAIVLLGIASAVVIPSIGSADALKVQSAVRAIVADINAAQSEALATQRGRAIVFDVAHNKYQIIEVNGTTLNPAQDLIREVQLVTTGHGLSGTIVAADFGGTDTLVFDELGGPVTGPGSSNPSAGGTVRVTGFGSTFELTVEAYTGRVTVQRLAGP